MTNDRIIKLKLRSNLKVKVTCKNDCYRVLDCQIAKRDPKVCSPVRWMGQNPAYQGIINLWLLDMDYRTKSQTVYRRDVTVYGESPEEVLAGLQKAADAFDFDD